MNGVISRAETIRDSGAVVTDQERKGEIWFIALFIQQRITDEADTV